MPSALRALVLGLLLAAPVLADEAPVATIAVSSATAGSTLGERLVQGVMTFRGRNYLLTLRGVAAPTSTVGSVYGLARARDIEGNFDPADGGLRNETGVTLRFDPPLALGERGLGIELSTRVYPKVSAGQGGSGSE